MPREARTARPRRRTGTGSTAAAAPSAPRPRPSASTSATGSASSTCGMQRRPATSRVGRPGSRSRRTAPPFARRAPRSVDSRDRAGFAGSRPAPPPAHPTRGPLRSLAAAPACVSRQAVDDEPQPPRRRERAHGPSTASPARVELSATSCARSLAPPRLHPRRDFLRQELEQQLGHAQPWPVAARASHASAQAFASARTRPM